MTSTADVVNTGEQIPVFMQLAEILDGVFVNALSTNPYWYGKASILRPILFRKRMGLEFDKKYLFESDNLYLNKRDICKALVEKHPNKTAKEIAIKFCDHAMQNDSLWSRSVGIPTLHSKLTGQAPSIRLSEQNRIITPTNRYIINGVRAEDIAYGTASYTERRYYRADMEVPEDVIQQAIDEDNINVIYDWLEDEMAQEDVYDCECPEYENHDSDGSEDFCITNLEDLRDHIRDIMDEYQANNPRDED